MRSVATAKTLGLSVKPTFLQKSKYPHLLDDPQVQFIGGEPTLFKDLLFLVEKNRELGYNFIELYTNATLLTEELNELMAYNVHIATSFYSYNPEHC